jgi:hypothetical protein
MDIVITKGSFGFSQKKAAIEVKRNKLNRLMQNGLMHGACKLSVNALNAAHMHTQAEVSRHCQESEFIPGEVSCKRKNFLSNPTPSCSSGIAQHCVCVSAIQR